MSVADPEDGARYTLVYGAVFGVIVGGPLLAFGVGVLQRPLYGAIAGILTGVGVCLFVPLLLCLNAAETAGEDVSYHEMVDRWGSDVRLGVFGLGITVGGVMVLVTGAAGQPAPDPMLGFRGGAIALVGSSLLALVVGWVFERTRRDRSGRDHPATPESRTHREQASDRSIIDDETGSGAIHGRFETLVRPRTAGAFFGALFAASFGLLSLSLIGLVTYLMLVPDAHGFVGIAGIVASWIGITVSLFGYSVWSASELRHLPRDAGQPTVRTPLRLTVHVVALLFVPSDDLDAYDRRLRLMTVTLVLAAIALAAPLLAQIGSPGRLPEP